MRRACDWITSVLLGSSTHWMSVSICNTGSCGQALESVRNRGTRHAGGRLADRAGKSGRSWWRCPSSPPCFDLGPPSLVSPYLDGQIAGSEGGGDRAGDEDDVKHGDLVMNMAATGLARLAGPEPRGRRGEK